jgi:UDP-N-acetylglucosamine 2-epimerase (non-hydrolysing)
MISKKILLVFGTRPEAIKMAPVYREFKNRDYQFETKICVTGQHREMLDQVLEFFDIIPDYDLNLMKPNQSLYGVTSDIIMGMKNVLEDFNPDYVLVHGDTTTTMAASLASFYHGSKVCHVEAGLRTHNKRSPFPEEINRQIVGRIADYHFTPTQFSKSNLIKENIEDKNIVVTGNTVIDALFQSIEKIKENPSSLVQSLEIEMEGRDVILVTGHRRENHGNKFLEICEALKEIAVTNKSIKIVYPVHLNPQVQKPVYDLLRDVDNIMLLDPLDYKDFIWLMNRSMIIITDSGGIQEEAPSLGKPVLVIRDITERPEAVEAGTVILVGTSKSKIVEECNSLLSDNFRKENMSALHNPYGDGKASERIADFLSNL